jgi:uncharacterized protein
MLYIVYFLCVAAAETITVFVNPMWGAISHIAILGTLLINSALVNDPIKQKFMLSLALAPLVRVVSLAMPLGTVPRTWWYPIIYAPLLGAAVVATRLQGYTRQQVAFTFKFTPIQILVGASGIVLGTIEYLILRPDPLINTLTWQTLWFPTLGFFAAVGFVEEYIFRGVMQTSAVNAIGFRGIIYVSGIFALLHMGFYSWLDVAFVFGIAFYFAVIVEKTGSLFGVTLSHGIANTILYLIAPFILR